ncbi:hypothetical protein BIV57_09465 [Mangrovactinospora gilvigrisea]|uniref:Uncharacterized protein n=1 Tax=Mangrovactinospora gilvigrisea TaxID=1428644 RepID=A0A1J7BGH7_9ACTN|nr:hypothetical protein [Mangrovactinospora gilvigrisea]OIV37787.1 hypothetical protein BIV57_09465 [Mangrovactinospora gilvigrisea]
MPGIPNIPNLPTPDDVKKLVNEMASQLPDSGPLYAAAGASDAARERITRLAADPRAARGELLGTVHEVQAKMIEAVGALAGGGVRQIPDRAQAFALQQVGVVVEAAGRARDAYDGYIERGRTVLGAEPEPAPEHVKVAEPPEEHSARRTANARGAAAPKSATHRGTARRGAAAKDKDAAPKDATAKDGAPQPRAARSRRTTGTGGGAGARSRTTRATAKPDSAGPNSAKPGAARPEDDGHAE